MSGVLWYLHDHGHGHLQRASAVLRHVTVPVVVAAGPGIVDAARVLERPIVALPPDSANGCACPRGPWHHAPVAPVQRDRMTALATAIERHQCVAAVVDVSAEVTALATLFGLRTVTLRQSGRRNDAAHRLAFAAADTVWVPQHRRLEPIDGPTDDRWRFTGAFSRFDRPLRAASTARRSGRLRRRALVVVGRGGSSLDVRRWRAASSLAGWRIAIAGTATRWRHGDVVALGHVDALGPWLRGADVVITNGGWASIADAAAFRRRLVVVPEERPFDEQRVRARALETAGLVRVLPSWPAPDQLAGVLADAALLDPTAWDDYDDGLGARRAAALVDEAGAA